MKKFFTVVLFVVLALSICADAQTRRRRKPKVVIPTVEQVAFKIDSIVAVRRNDSIAVELRPDSVACSYVRSLPAGFDRKGLSDLYVGRMAAYSEAENIDSLRLACRTVVALSDSISLPTAYEGLAQIYAFEADTEVLRDVLAGFTALSESLPDNPYAETIANMAKEYDDVINPVPFIDKVRGVWVSYNRKNLGGVDYYPWSIIKITALDNGGIYLRNIPGHTTDNFCSDVSGLYRSQYLGGYDGHIEVSFGSENLNVGDSKFAESGFETTRKLRAETRGTIASANTSFGNKMAATAITELTAGLLDALLMSTATSYKTVGALNLNLDLKTPEVLSGNAEYYLYTANVNNVDSRPTPNFSGNIEYVKWEPSDDAYFISPNGYIESVGAIPADLQLKIREIQKKYSYRNPKYLFPLLGGELLAAGLVGGGYYLMCSDIENLRGGRLVGSISLLVAGIAVAVIPPCIISEKMKHKRNAAFGELNKESFRKLQRKATMSLTPVVDVDNTGDIAFGVGGRISF